jgi:UPF0271 protein
MQIETKELVACVLYQLSALDGMARTAGHRMTHMSFHGALGNMAAADAALADPLVRAVADFDPTLTVSTSASRAIEGVAERCGLRVRTTFLADRACGDDGLLVPRKLPDAVLARVRQLLEEGIVTSVTGKKIPMRVHSILLHGDTPGAVELARAVRGVVEQAGRVVPISRQSI